MRQWEIITACFAFESVRHVRGATTCDTGVINGQLPPPAFLMNAVRAVPLPIGALPFTLADGSLELHIGARRYLRAPLAAIDIWLTIAPAELHLAAEPEAIFQTDVPAIVMVRGMEYRDTSSPGNIRSDAAGLDRAFEILKGGRHV